ncbi:MAG TPA: GAF domain-containing protein [Flavisolibacter sp.]|nr:GAF domain-containing protein [Flavisolibacter sp.]
MEILDTLPEEDFDELVELASRICETPISTITLIDSDRQWFKAQVGLEVSQTERSVSFCGHAILQTDLLVVPDATKDERFSDNPLVSGTPNIRFYAGAQIRTDAGHKVGTLCVIDTRPRELTWHQASALRILSRQASRLLELRYLKIHGYKVEEDPVFTPEQLVSLIREQGAYHNRMMLQYLQPIKTGRFTKKELTASSQQAHALLNEHKRFHDLLGIFQFAKQAAAAAPSHELDLNEFLVNLSRRLSGDTAKGASRFQLQIPEHFTLRNYNPVFEELIGQLMDLLTCLQPLTVVEGYQREKWVELKFHTALYLDNLAEVLNGQAQTQPAGAGCLYGLYLMRLIIVHYKGQLEIVRHPVKGTDLLLNIPVA